MIELKRCPICGRRPKFYGYEIFYGGYKCKGLFKTHLDTDYGECSEPSRVMPDARERWNKLVDEYNQNNNG